MIWLVKCNNCGEIYDEEDLEFMHDDDGEAMNACPRCLTDAYLMDIGEDNE